MQLSQCQLCSFLVFRCSLFLFSRAHSRPWLCRSSPSATSASFSTSTQVHILHFYSLLLIYTSTQVHLLQPLQEHTFCLLPTLYKSTSSAKAHLLHPRICVLFVRKLWDPMRNNSRFWSLTSRERTEVRSWVQRWTFQSGKRYLLICHKLLKMKFWRPFWLLEMFFSHFSHDLSRELVTKINYSGAIILPSVMRWPMEPLKTLKS